MDQVSFSIEVNLIQLTTYSGHFQFTLMLGENGFNELDMSLLKHLLYNKKPVAFVRTKCDSAVSGIQDEYEDEVSFTLYFNFSKLFRTTTKKFRSKTQCNH